MRAVWAQLIIYAAAAMLRERSASGRINFTRLGSGSGVLHFGIACLLESSFEGAFLSD